MRKGDMVQQKDTERGVLETTKSSIPGSDEKEKKISQNGKDPECGRRRRRR